MNRRSFVKNTGILMVAGASVTGAAWCAGPSLPHKNKLPKWKGFNLLDFFIPDPVPFQHATTEEHIKWMHDWGFDFIRLPVSYPTYLQFDRSRNITPEEVYKIDEKRVNDIDTIIHWAHKYNMHVSLNLHRAPGYCISAGFHEPFNLWKDEAAQKAFYYHWGMWAKRYKDISSNKISFDLLNEPVLRDDMNDPQARVSAVPASLYRKIVTGAIEVIHKENPHYLIIADGNSGGTDPVPELADLPVHQSCRGYTPFSVSHFKAAWASPDPEHMPIPQWPGRTGNDVTNRRLLENYYEPWTALLAKGVGVHCGECGCFNKTPHAVFLAWFNDVLDILSKNNIGFALWNFIGDFGVIDSNRTDVAYENWQGHKLDRKLLNLLKKY